MLLQIEDLHKSFGGVTAVKGFNLSVKEGEIVSIIGPNGAGKTTIFNLITGFYTPDKGRILYQENDITNLKPHLIGRLGIARTFQNIRLFWNLNLLDNIRVSFHFQRNYNIIEAIIKTKNYRTQEGRINSLSLYLLKIFGLEAKKDALSSSLPYGDQRKLEIMRAIATGAKLILLDEPTAGMNPSEQQNIIDLIRFIKSEFNLTLILIEHQMKVVMGISQRIVVMNFGEIIAEGTPHQIQNDPAVIEAYLGREDAVGG